MKWFIRHTKLFTRLFIVLGVVLIILFSYFDVLRPIHTWLIFMVALILYALIINNLSINYLKKIVAEFERTCNPKEYIELLNLYYEINPGNVSAKMNYVVALMLDRSNLPQARMLMESINIDKLPKRAVGLKYIYYNNLCLIYVDLDELDKADEAYGKALQYDSQIKNQAARLQNQQRLAGIACELAEKRNDAETALTYLPKLRKDTLLAKVSYALHLARIYIIQNETEKAKEQLSFVIENASEICDGQEAKELLAKIS